MSLAKQSVPHVQAESEHGRSARSLEEPLADRSSVIRPSEKPLQPHTVIIGAGFGGLKAARELARRGFPVTLIDRRSYHQFTPLLYQVATGSLAPSEIAVPIRSVFRGEPKVRCLMANVTGVDFDARQVELEDGAPIAFDYVIIAAGAQSHYFGNEEKWKNEVYTLDDIASAEHLRDDFLTLCEHAEREHDSERRREMLTVAVIGAGPSGVELAGAIADLADRTLSAEYHNIDPGDVRVVLFEAVDRVLPMFEPRLSEKAKLQLEQLGVEVRLGTPIESVEHGSVTTKDGTMRCGLICWGSGVRPANVAGELEVTKEKGKIRVDEHCGIPGYPHAFAVGDIAHFEQEGGEPLPGLAPVALQQGTHVAQLIYRESKGEARRPFRYRDKGIMATIGRSRAVVQAGPLRLWGFAAWISWVVLHVMYLIDFRSRLLVMMEWIWAYFGSKRGNRLIEAERPRRGA